MPDTSPEFYEFEGVRLYAEKSELVRLTDRARFSIRPKERDFLKALLDRSQQTVPYGILQQIVWPEVADAQSAMSTMRETKRTLDALLRDVTKSSAHIIKTVVNEGYSIQAIVVASDVSRAVTQECQGKRGADSASEGEYTNGINRHIWASCALYSLLFSIALALEVAYQWDRLGRLALLLGLPVFAWIMITSMLGLKIDERWTMSGKSGGLGAAIVCFLTATTALVVAVSFFLPPFPITESSFQTYPAQAAYIKDAASFLMLALLFLLLPFHFLIAMRRALAVEPREQLRDFLIGNKLGMITKGTVYPRFWVLCSLLILFALIAIAGTAHLLDHLKPGTYLNLFVQVIYLRWIVYFGLGILCLWWYYGGLNAMKRVYLAEGNGEIL
jgi:DNA-binding winged helix-turn-helix (wHTH) protein